MSFSSQLKKAMYERDITQSELAAQTGMAKSSISQYLSGKNQPKNDMKQKLADALEVLPTFFDGTTDDPETITDIRKMSVKQAADALGKSQQFVRIALQRGIAPFGFAVKMSDNRWTYHISLKKFREYTEVS